MVNITAYHLIDNIMRSKRENNILPAREVWLSIGGMMDTLEKYDETVHPAVNEPPVIKQPVLTVKSLHKTVINFH